MKPVCVVIPLYKPDLSADEHLSLAQTCRMLHRHPLVVVCPEGMETRALHARYPLLAFHAFPAPYFASIKGYNRLCLSREFYAAFAAYDYILICQTDCWVFRDELLDWCRRGYDYVGAPWLGRRVYTLPFIRQAIALHTFIAHRLARHTQHDRYGRVGNGGFSLRRVESHLRAIDEMPERVRLYAEERNRQHLFNEDTFWALEPSFFRYPSQEEAMLFAYNKYPELSFRLTHGATPFGCHGWSKPRYRAFWEKTFKLGVRG